MRRIAATIVVAALAVTASASVVVAEQSPATGREHRNDRASRDHHRWRRPCGLAASRARRRATSSLAAEILHEFPPPRGKRARRRRSPVNRMETTQLQAGLQCVETVARVGTTLGHAAAVRQAQNRHKERKGLPRQADRGTLWNMYPAGSP